MVLVLLRMIIKLVILFIYNSLIMKSYSIILLILLITQISFAQDKSATASSEQLRPVFLVDGEIIDRKKGIALTDLPQQLSVQLIANPADGNNYQIVECMAYLAKGKRPYKKLLIKNNLHLPSFLKQATAGYRIIIEITRATRTNEAGNTTAVKMGNHVFSIPIY